MVDFHRVSVEDLLRLHQLVLKNCPAYSIVMHFYAGGIWKGDILVADIQEIGGNGRLWSPDPEDLDLTTSTIIGYSPDEGEKQEIFEENQTGLFQPHDMTHRGMVVSQKWFWVFFQEISFTVVTWNTASNCTCRLKHHIQLHWNFSTLPESPVDP